MKEVSTMTIETYNKANDLMHQREALYDLLWLFENSADNRTLKLVEDVNNRVVNSAKINGQTRLALKFAVNKLIKSVEEELEAL